MLEMFNCQKSKAMIMKEMFLLVYRALNFNGKLFKILDRANSLNSKDQMLKSVKIEKIQKIKDFKAIIF